METFMLAYTYEIEGLFRLLLAAMLGGIMGLERTRKRREAGFRTYMLVALGAAMTMMIREQTNDSASIPKRLIMFFSISCGLLKA